MSFLKGIDTLDTIQVALVVLFSILVANYIYLKWSWRVNREAEIAGVEGFANPDGPDGDIIVLGNEHLYDEFYAKIYDQIVDGAARTDAEVNLSLSWVKSIHGKVETVSALDIGSGTGHGVEMFKKAGVAKAIGLDASDAMVAAARSKYPKNDYRVGEAEQIGQFAAGEFTLATMFYFTYYYLRDPTAALTNAFNWLQPGGCLVIHLVNREKFDPILESASPFVAFSVQKYSKERITRSRVASDKFEYEANFDIHGANAEFREEFKFKNKKLRRQVHKLSMPTMDQVVRTAENCGFVYKQFIDLTALGYEYQYLFCFVR